MRGSGGADGHSILGNAINVMPVPDNRPRTMMIDEDEDNSDEHDIDNTPPLVKIHFQFFKSFPCAHDVFCKSKRTRMPFIRILTIKTPETRMHSSRMRTGRWLTVCQSLLPGGWGGGSWGDGVIQKKKSKKKIQKNLKKKYPQKYWGGGVLSTGGCT